MRYSINRLRKKKELSSAPKLRLIGIWGSTEVVTLFFRSSSSPRSKWGSESIRRRLGPPKMSLKIVACTVCLHSLKHECELIKYRASEWVSEWVDAWIRPSPPPPLIHALLLSECCCRSPHIINQLFTSSLLMFNEWGCCGQLLMNCGRGEKAQRRGQNGYCTQFVCTLGHAYTCACTYACTRANIPSVSASAGY